MSRRGKARREAHYAIEYSSPLTLCWFKGFKRTKRFVLVFETWGNPDLKNTREITEYDTEAEWKEEASLLDEYYADTPKPTLRDKEIKNGRWLYHGDYYKDTMHGTSCYISYDYVIEDKAKFWGYIVLDFEKQDIIKFGGEGIKSCWKERFKDYKRYQLLDAFFRGDDEIPAGYNWDSGEYRGWLRFRWGDGKNAIDYRPPKKCGLHTCGEEYNEEEESYLDELEKDFQKSDDKEWVTTRLDRW